ncbi:MAG: cell wall hydrolase [Clostridiales bacterium]|nr:cell wall hydrolase [Clostridiales bacterium]
MIMERERWHKFGAAGAALTLLVVGLAVGLGLGSGNLPAGTQAAATGGSAQPPLLLLDPGHGGIDGGAVSAKGLPEKDINLAIALEVQRLAEADGWKTVLTRSDDRGLYEGVTVDDTGAVTDLNGKSIRSLKTEDLKNRKAMADELKPDAAVSIHLNSYKEDPSVRGAQVFYGSKGDAEVLEQGRLLAEKIQAALIQGLADGNHRTAMSEGGVRFLQKPAAPTVLVECGFLSNPEEAALLADPAYQKKLAACIYAGLCAHCGRQPEPELPPLTDTRQAGR